MNNFCLTVQCGMWDAEFILIPIKEGARRSLLIVSGHRSEEEAPVILHLNPVGGEHTPQLITGHSMCAEKHLEYDI